MFDVIVQKNCRTGRTEIFKVTKYENLSEEEADNKINELLKSQNKYVFSYEISSIESFLETFGDLTDLTTQYVHSAYIDYCKQNGLKAENKIAFSRYINQHCGYKSIGVSRDSRTCRIYKQAR
jgi:hypothetical protein